MKHSILFIFLLLPALMMAQGNPPDSNFKTMAAGPEYKKSAFYQWLWGKNNRKEWITPVKFPILDLNTAHGGLVPDEEGGGHQTVSLHLKSKDEKRKFVIRSVDKSLAKLVPVEFKKTFIDHIANDEISMSNPYGALAVPYMEEKAGIYHATPKYFYVPQQAALDSDNKKYGNRLYLLEEKPEKGNNSFGGFDKYINSEKMEERIQESSEYMVDQKAFVRDRLFDMLIGDWDRHDKQWKWGETDSGKYTVYEPIPSDRDQAFSTFDGKLQKLVISAAGMKYLKTFDHTIKEVQTFDYERRILDRWLSNKLTVTDWVVAANSLKQVLTDEVITTSIQQVPPEIFAIRGTEIIAKLKSRRDHLDQTSAAYYKFLAEEVEVVGTRENDYFEITRVADNNTQVDIYKINKEGEKKTHPYYSRLFKGNETQELRLFGLSGNDVFKITGSASGGTRIRIIGGDMKDSIIDQSNGGKKVDIYDEGDNVIQKGSHTRVHQIQDSAGHDYDFDTFRPDKHGLAPVFFYNDADRFYVGIAYSLLHHKWHKLPFASQQKLAVHYSLSQKAFSVWYNGLFPKLLGKLDMDLEGGYDAVRWINFFGLGNETEATNKGRDFYQLRYKTGEGSLGIGKLLGRNRMRLSGFVQSETIISDSGRFVSKTITPVDPAIYTTKNYAGAELLYTYYDANDPVIPTKGFAFTGVARYSQNLGLQKNAYEKFSGTLDLYVPLSKKFSLAFRNGGGTVAGNPEFYQYMYIGGANDLRGYRRERFWGQSAFYNSNELRYITNFRSHLFNGKVGLVAFGDDGRVWMPGEQSGIWHYSYGGGILVAPFSKIMTDITFGMADDMSFVQLRVFKAF